MRKWLLAAAAAAVFAVPGASMAQAPIILKFSHVVAPNTPKGKGAEKFKELGSLEFSKRLLDKAKVCVSPGIGFGDHGDDFVRFALIENESRIRQAVRGIRAMFKADAAVAA